MILSKEYIIYHPRDEIASLLQYSFWIKFVSRFIPTILSQIIHKFDSEHVPEGLMMRSTRTMYYYHRQYRTREYCWGTINTEWSWSPIDFIISLLVSSTRVCISFLRRSFSCTETRSTSLMASAWSLCSLSSCSFNLREPNTTFLNKSETQENQLQVIKENHSVLQPRPATPSNSCSNNHFEHSIYTWLQKRSNMVALVQENSSQCHWLTPIKGRHFPKILEGSSWPMWLSILKQVRLQLYICISFKNFTSLVGSF